MVRGRQNAESVLKKLAESQPPSDHHEGWRYFCEKSDLKAGIQPDKATDLRQADLEARESKALRDNPLPPPSSDPHR